MGHPESINDDLTPRCHTVATGLQQMDSIDRGQDRDARTPGSGRVRVTRATSWRQLLRIEAPFGVGSPPCALPS
jgi:hypothetical protein